MRIHLVEASKSWLTFESEYWVVTLSLHVSSHSDHKRVEVGDGLGFDR